MSYSVCWRLFSGARDAPLNKGIDSSGFVDTCNFVREVIS